MNELQVFSNSEFGEIRTTAKDGQAYFCLADVCRVLGIKNSSDAKKRLKQKGVAITDTLTNGGIQQVTFIDESNLYKLIFQSRKPEAESFTEWVTTEVLPTIRKHGLYAVDELIANPDMAIKAFTALKEERIARIEAERKNAVLMHVNKTYTITEIAKEIGLKSANELNKELERRGIQFRVNDTWVPKADYANLGYFSIKQEVLDNGAVIYHRRVTQEGRVFILSLFARAA